MFKKILTNYAALLLVTLFITKTTSAIQVNIGVNNGSNTATTNPNPLQDWYCTQYAQYLYTATELQNAGLTPNSIITAAGWNTLALASTSTYFVENYTIYMKNTTVNALNAWESGMTTVSTPTNLTTQQAVGINYTTLSNVFIWDGVSNLVVQVCGGIDINQGGSFTSHPSVAWTTGLPFNATYMFVDDGQTECNNTLIPPTTFVYTPTTRPVLYLDYIPGTPCSGQPTAGIATTLSPVICPGLSAFITSTGITLAANMTYQWQESTNGGLTWTNIIVNGNGPSYTTPSLLSTTEYRIYTVCNNSGLSDTSTVQTITVTGPSYASLPYVQDFETWSNFCATSDVPIDGSTIHFSNFPSSGANSWRREDQGSTAAWINPIFGIYTPLSSTGSHSARFHSYNTNGNGSLDLYIDCSTSIGNKTLLFDYKNDNLNFFGFDFLEIQMSTNGGGLFSTLQLLNSSPGWTTFPILINSNSVNTIIRFKAYGDYQLQNDIGIDNIRVLEPCTGSPIAGNITPYTPCPNVPFDVTLTGNVLASGLSYQWESAPTATGPWTILGTTTVPSFNTQIAFPTFFRCVVTCTASGQSTTTPAYQYNMASFYVCYCQSYSTSPFTQNIGRFKVTSTSTTLLDNGSATPLTNNINSNNAYSNFTNLTPLVMYRDSTYTDSLFAISYTGTFNAGYAKVYIDYDHDGIYDPNTENVSGGLCNSPSQQMVSTYTVLNSALFGITGMRVVYQEGGTASSVNPCGLYIDGETEDYLVNIVPPPCVHPPFAGAATISDTIICPNYSVFLQDTTHHLLYSGLSFNWEYSSDGINFSTIPGAVLDTLSYTVSNNSWFRFRTICSNSITDTSYSNIVHVFMNQPIQCYPQSIAIGGINDSTDIGAMNIMDMATNNNIYSIVTGGPHLGNPLAVKGRTDYTSNGAMVLITDSTYGLSAYNIMRSDIHADARVTVFIDYNNNQQYDIPSERVYSGVSGVSTFYLLGSFTTPTSPAIATNVGMRVIINNDLGFSAASDNGVGTYISGETEEYVVRFAKKANTTSINEEAFDINQVNVYPNPAKNVLNIALNAKNTTDIEIRVLTITGTEIMTKQLKNVFGKTNTAFDVSELSRGTYMIELTSTNGKFVRKISIE
jgi:hypothetical protein